MTTRPFVLTGLFLVILLGMFLSMVFAYAQGQENSDNQAFATTTPLIAMSSVSVVISEVLPYPSAEGTEWIEVFNASTSSVDLTGWQLFDGAGKIITATGTLDALTYRVFDLTHAVLNNSGDALYVKDSTGKTVDQLVYGNWSAASSTVAAPAQGSSLARDINTKENSGFFISTHITKGSANIVISVVEKVADSSPIVSSTPATESTSTVQIPPLQSTPLRAVLINEFVSDPADNQEEFIELFNTTEAAIDLTGWIIEDGAESQTLLSGIVQPASFFVIEKPKGSLNNAGDAIVIMDTQGTIIDEVAYGNWNDGNVSDNPPAPKDPWSLARTVSSSLFVLTDTITKGGVNNTPKEMLAEAASVSNTSFRHLVISEVFPNPKGSDTVGEFIELHNKGSERINISRVSVGDMSKTRFVFGTSTMEPHGFAVVYRPESKISLNNSGKEIVSVYAPDNTVINSVTYEGAAGEDESYALTDAGVFEWTSALTPGQSNTIQKKNHAPDISANVPNVVTVGETVLFDASDTTDSDQDALAFYWNMQGKTITGEIVETQFSLPGTYVVVLRVADIHGAESVKKMRIKVQKSEVEENIMPAGTSTLSISLLSELFPDPAGSDMEEEFIELHNAGIDQIDMSNMFLDDEDGGSKPYRFPVGTIIHGGQFAVFDRKTTGLALNNTMDAVRLLHPDKAVYEEIIFPDTHKNAVYMKNTLGQWEWSTEQTPGTENMFVALGVSATTSKKRGKSNIGKPVIRTTLAGIKEEELGDLVEVEGVVSAAPGSLSKDFFYLTGDAGMQIYLRKKSSPKIAVGDLVRVTGEITESKGERRLTASGGEVKIIRHANAPQAQEAEIATLSDASSGLLYMVEGEITEAKGTYAYIDDGTEEIKAYFSRGANIAKKKVQVGDRARIIGIVRATKDGPQLYPREDADVQIVEAVSKTSDALETRAISRFAPSPSQKKIYAYITGGGIVSVIGVVIAKKKLKK